MIITKVSRPNIDYLLIKWLLYLSGVRLKVWIIIYVFTWSEVILHAQNWLIILGSIVNIIGGTHLITW